MKLKFIFLLAIIFSASILNAQTYIRQGKGDYNTVLYTWDGKYLRQGKGDYNTVLYTIIGDIPIEILIFTL